MKAFLTAHGRQLDPSLFYALSKEMTGKHAQLREILTNFISNNSQVFGRGWTIENCTLEEHLAKVAKVGQYGSHAEIKAAASLFQTPMPLTHLIWGSVCAQSFPHLMQLNLTS